MSRRSFTSGMRMIARAAAQAERARQQAETRHRAAATRQLRDAQRKAKADAKETAHLYLTARVEEAEDMNREVQQREAAITGLLVHALKKKPAVSPSAVIEPFGIGIFNDGPWQGAAPSREDREFQPEPMVFFSRVLPGAATRRRKAEEKATTRFEAADAVYQKKRQDHSAALKQFDAAESGRRAEHDRKNAAVDEFYRKLHALDHASVVAHLKLVLERSLTGEPDAFSAEVGYSPDSRHLVVDLELPEISAVPEEGGFRYIKAGDRIDPILRPPAKRKALYANLLYQVALKCVDTVFRGSPAGVVDCLTLNGMLDTIDPSTGQQVRVCLLSVRVTADAFRSLNLAQVEPEQCLRSLKATVSRSPSELLPVKPIVELDMVDPRFVDTMDVMSGLEHRPNLMELSPTEFEGLITNLFAAMGLDTRQTRPSRDGGVDCVAFDPRPVFGGKVVIQAKRYKNTVGVSAVRDLFGTVQNEGASKGILVTTSGYGKAAFEFAKGKPLELLDGGNLLHLLAEHAAIEARIIMPDGWVDLPIHGE
jgi:restriction system protein